MRTIWSSELSEAFDGEISRPGLSQAISNGYAGPVNRPEHLHGRGAKFLLTEHQVASLLVGVVCRRSGLLPRETAEVAEDFRFHMDGALSRSGCGEEKFWEQVIAVSREPLLRTEDSYNLVPKWYRPNGKMPTFDSAAAVIIDLRKIRERMDKAFSEHGASAS